MVQKFGRSQKLVDSSWKEQYLGNITPMKDLREFLYGVQKKIDSKTSKIPGELDRKNVLSLKILVMIDVSGSIDVTTYNMFIKQINKIKGLSVIKIMEMDTEVTAFYSFQKLKNPTLIKLNGGGGTDFHTPFKEAVKLKPDAILCFTDGDVCKTPGTNANGIPTGWILSEEGGRPYNFGEVVRIIKE